MSPIAGYTDLREIRRGTNRLLVRGWSAQDGARVLIAKLRDGVDAGLLANLRSEFRVLHDLDVSGVVRPLRLEEEAHAIVYEDCEGVLLADWLRKDGPLSIKTFLCAAVPLARTVAELHAADVTHGQICPQNILYDAAQGTTHLLGFDLATRTGQPAATPVGLDRFGDTLPYISPEQTGRLNRVADQRTDLYSLGATFYAMLTGHPPFRETDPLEVVHRHVAQRPTPIVQVRKEAPRVLSELVDKLLEKAPEDRYPGARLLLSDLECCADQLQKTGEIEPFALAQAHVPQTLEMPGRLVGRQEDVKVLREHLESAAQGAKRFVVIEGPSGVGKSQLVSEMLQEPLTKDWEIAFGRFLPEAYDRPLGGISRAIGDWLRRVALAPHSVVELWKRRLRKNLGDEAAILVELVPELEWLFPSSTLSEDQALAGAEARLLDAFRMLFRAIAGREHPLLFILDDLDWADTISERVLSALCQDEGLQYLCLLTTRRTQEGAMPARFLQEVHQWPSAEVSTLVLQPLSRQGTLEFVAGVVRMPIQEAEPLAEVVFQHTKGVPLHVQDLLRIFHERRWLVFDVEANRWKWNLGDIEKFLRAQDITKLVADRMGLLPEGTRRLLRVASCFGSSFDAELVAALEDTSEAEVRTLLTPALQGDLILHEAAGSARSDARAGGFRFAHEEVHKVLYGQMETSERARLHLKAARILDSRYGTRKTEWLFEVVRHLNQALDTIVDPAERLRTAELNLQAGRAARRAGTFRMTEPWFRAGIAALGADAWASNYDLKFQLELESAEAALCQGRQREAEERIEALLAHAVSDLDMAKASRLRVIQRTAQGRFAEALESGHLALDRLGRRIDEGDDDAAQRLLTWARALEGQPSLLSRETPSDPATDQAVTLISTMLRAAFVLGDRARYEALAACSVELAMNHGPSAESWHGLLAMGVVMADRFQEYRLASTVGEIGVDLSERLAPQRASRARGLQATCLLPLVSPLHRATEVVERARQEAMRAGDAEYVAYTWHHKCVNLFFMGTSLEEIVRCIDGLDRYLEGAPVPFARLTNRAVRSAISGLWDPKADAEHTLVQSELRDPAARFPRFAYHSLHGVRCYLLGEWRAARRTFEVRQSDSGGCGVVSAALTDVVETLVLAALAGESSGQEREELLDRIEHLQSRTKGLAQVCPANFLHGWLLVEAERARLDGRTADADAAYHAAIEGAAEEGWTWYEGLGHELAARFWMVRGREPYAAHHAREARTAYRRWGAGHKVHRLQREFAGLLASSEPIVRSGDITPASGSRSELFDTLSVVKASQVIAEEVDLDAVVDRVMATALENAGAQRGVLLLESGGVIGIAAEARVAEGAARFDKPIPLENEVAGNFLPLSMVRYALHTGEPIVVENAEESRFGADRFIRENHIRSALCVPIQKQSRRVGLLYLENRLVQGVFTDERLRVLQLLSTQAASSIENAQLYKALSESEQQWRSLVMNAPDHILILDRIGRVAYLNRPFRHFGIDVTPGTRLEEMVDASQGNALRAVLESVILHGRRESLEVQLRADAGEAGRWYTARFGPVYSGQRVETAIAVFTDVTERKREEERRAALEAQLRQKQKLESLGTLASGVAHEINNPIQGVMNYATLIRRKLGSAETVQEYATEIIRESERIATIVRNLLAFARQEREAYRVTNVKQIVEGTVSLIRTILRRDQIELELHIPDDLQLTCRSQQMQQVVMNLITNARDALVVRYRAAHPDKKIRVLAEGFMKGGNPWVRVTVEDRGIGISEEVMPRIFDPFFTTKSQDMGTGLGLSVSHGIVREHGGELWVETAPKGYTRFHMELPSQLERKTE